MNNKDHIALINTFYEAFVKRDHDTMGNCYHADAKFQDEAFTLQGKEIGAMWHMLCDRGKDLTLTFSVSEQEDQVTAHWEPIYSFSQTGNKVHNIIDATFEFKDGKIYRHTDRFSFWRWSKQALGAPGLLLGWTPFLQNKVRQKARNGLDDFIAANEQYQA